jgi:hypothetical protein
VDFKAVAREVLWEVGRPLHYTGITEIALRIATSKTPGGRPRIPCRPGAVDVRVVPDAFFV